MKIALGISIFLITFSAMEFVAWFTHKYILHGVLWSLHKDHHKKDHDSWFERNDAFFIFYAALSMSFFYAASIGYWLASSVGLGILCYGMTYFLVHDIFIHQRFKLFRNTNNWYAKGLRRAHKIHHKQLAKNDGECFGMLLVPFKYFRKGD